MSLDAIELRAGDLVFDALAAGPADGRPVLLLHGFPQVNTMWRFQMEKLAEAGYRAVAPNQRGYASGARPDDVAAYHVDHLVNDVVSFGDALGADRFDLVGHDWGAIVGWHVAIRHPERLRSWCAVSVPHPSSVARALDSGKSDQKERSSYITLFRAEGNKAEALLLEDDAHRLRRLLSFSGADEGVVEETVRAMQEPGRLTAALNWYRAMERPRFEGGSTVRVPTLFVGSTNDLAVSPESAAACAEYVDAPFRSEMLEGITHWIPDEAPDDLNRFLQEHLAETS